MSQALTLFLSDSGTHRWLHPGIGAGSGSLEALPAPGRLPLEVVVPGEPVYVCAVQLPGRQLERKRQALPYQMEEQLVQEVESYHFALGAALADGRHLAGAVERSVMARWMSALAAAGLEPDRMVPETLLPPAPERADQAVITIGPSGALVRIGSDRAYAAGLEDLGPLLELESGLAEVTLVDPEQRWQCPPSLRCRRVTLDEPLEAWLARRVPDAALNLLQGPYAGRREAGNRVARAWRLAAAAAAGVCVLAIADRALSWRNALAEAERLAEQTRTTVAQALGTLPPGFDALRARPLLESRLSSLRGAAGGADGLLFLLEAVGPMLAAGENVQLQSLTYRDDGLILELTASGLEDIESLRQRIGAETGVPVELESASTLAEGTGARLRIGGAAG